MSVRSLNKVMLIGNLTRDPNLRYTPTGTAVCSFSIATNRTWAPADGGEKQEQVEYHNCVAWGKLAEICGQLLQKGAKVFVEGRLQTRDWKSNEGQDRRTTEIVVSDMMLLQNPRGAYQADDSQAEPTEEVATTPAGASDDQYQSDDVSEVEDVSDDIPF